MAGTVLVTGGSGYIAGYLIRQLVREGWTVHTTIRSLGREAEVRETLGIAGPELQFFAADLMNDAGWADAVAGCTHVAHVASPFPPGAIKHEDDLIVPAREGALRALRFAREAGVQRFVQTSSVAAIAYGRDDLDRPFTEADWSDMTSPNVAAYPKSKTIAERAARDWMTANGGAMEYCSINPAAVLGPVLSADYSASIEFVKRAIDGSVPGFPRLGFAVVDVRDLADLHVRALTVPGLANERFIAAGRFLMMNEVGQILRDRLGPDARKVPKRNIPDFAVRLIALFDGSLRQVLGELGRVRAVDSSHALEVFGWQTRPIEDSIVDTARSLIDRGIVKI
ncbi:NAD-dependent epimerase/dehydratase family protein [Sphingomonas sp. So64.6b]|uniref:NAD-dependent epimerase/dehydratase family protein n=1 Tax=Sphingomonas sp. So64.6b TaxID=2997354 RepID=UPI0016048164|nr:NAD-dependent epimerase/dehydratase family protein [Sphingomonas sp. So64.6b]QNA82754.1 NAD-dependent epimerase/dehydratase family protein [Sphingomonas sp. So64.6b]